MPQVYESSECKCWCCKLVITNYILVTLILVQLMTWIASELGNRKYVFLWAYVLCTIQYNTKLNYTKWPAVVLGVICCINDNTRIHETRLHIPDDAVWNKCTDDGCAKWHCLSSAWNRSHKLISSDNRVILYNIDCIKHILYIFVITGFKLGIV